MMTILSELGNFAWANLDWIILAVWMMGSFLIFYRQIRAWWEDDAFAAQISEHTIDDNRIRRAMKKMAREQRGERMKYILPRSLLWPFYLAWSIGVFLGKCAVYPFIFAADRSREAAIESSKNRKKMSDDNNNNPVRVTAGSIICSACNMKIGLLCDHNCQGTIQTVACHSCSEIVNAMADHHCKDRVITCRTCNKAVRLMERHSCTPVEAKTFPGVVRDEEEAYIYADNEQEGSFDERGHCDDCDIYVASIDKLDHNCLISCAVCGLEHCKKVDDC